MLRTISFALLPLLVAGATTAQALVKDINPLVVNGSGLAATTSPLLSLGSVAYFAGNDGVNGTELCRTDGTAAGTFVVKDINAGSLSSSPTGFAAFGGGVVFAATEATSGQELWKSDGTAAGTVLVADIYPGTVSSAPSGFTVIGTSVYFAATDSTTTTGVGRELWKYDGATVSLVKDIQTGATGSISTTGNMIAVGTTLYFAAVDLAATGIELWRSDGTAAGTVLVKDINTAASGSSSPAGLVAFGSLVIFAASDGATSGIEPWASDGTAAGTVMLKDITPGATSSSPTFFTVAGGKCFFSAQDSTVTTGTGRELYVTDGTPAGTSLIVDLNPGTAAGVSSITGGTVAFGSKVLFVGITPATGTELFVSDGTVAGTTLFADLWVGPNSGAPAPQFVFNGKVYTNATDGSYATGNFELMVSDGTPAGTKLIKDVWLGASTGDPQNFFALTSATTFYFVANDGLSTGIELWKSDGTAAGTVLVKDLNTTGATAASSSPGAMVRYKDKLWFSANDGTNGIGLWSTDGTAAGTTRIPGPSAVTNLTVFNNKLYFSASNQINGTELWASDGTAAGTAMLKDINTATVPPVSASSSPTAFTVAGSKLYFTANDGLNGIELWVTDGTAAGTILLKDIAPGTTSSSPAVMTAFGTKLFFRATDSTTTGTEPYITDGTVAGTLLLKDIGLTTTSSTPSNPTVNGNKLFFVASDTSTTGTELYVTDGTAAGTVLVIDLFAGTSSGCVTTALSMISYGSGVLFSGNNGTTVNGAELFSSDGTAAGTTLVKDINVGVASASPANMTAFGTLVLFTATTAAAGAEPWVTDGTAAGTVQLLDAYPGTTSSSAASFVVAGSAAFFLATNSTSVTGTGRELYVTDGTPAGTSLVLDIAPGTASGCSAAPVAIGVGKRVVLNATDGTNGNELWVSDGTAAGTTMVGDLNPGTLSSSPTNFGVIGNVLVFSATNGTDKIALPASVGVELFGVPLATLKASEVEQIGTGCAGVNGIPTVATTGGAPFVGNAAFGVSLGNAAPSQPCALWLSNTRSDITFGPCTFHPSLAIFVTSYLGTTAAGTCSAALPVPANAALVGQQLWMQWVVRDTAGAFGPGLTSFSPGLRVRVGGS